MGTGKDWKQKGIGGNSLVDIKQKKGFSIEGTYKGHRFIESTDSTIHTIETKEGLFDFWGTGQLNSLLSSVEAETEVKIEYEGMKNIEVKIGNKKVKKDVHQFKVYTR